MHELTITLHNRDQVRLTGPAGAASVIFRNPCTPEQVETLRWLLEDCSLLAIGPEHRRQTEALSAVDDLGVALFRALSATAESAALLRPVVETPEEYAVRVVSEDAEFLGLPWELLRPPGDTAWSLAWAAELVRCRVTQEQVQPAATCSPGTGPLRVLLISPRPFGAADVRPRTVRGPLLRAAELTCGAVEVDLLRPATFERLQAMLADQDGYDILHFDGHGYAGTDINGTGTFTSGVIFEDGDGRARLVSADEFADVVPAGRIPLIVLNACRSAYQEASAASGPAMVDKESSVASALMRRGAGAVLAMTHTVDASVVATFMTDFYDALAGGSTVAAAVSDGRRALLTEPIDGRERARPFHIIPVLYEQHAVQLRAPAGSPHGSRSNSPDPEPESVQSLMYQDGELSDIDRHLHDASPVVVHGPVASGKSVLLRAYTRYALLTRGFDHVVFTAGEQLAADDSLLLRRVRDNARTFAGRAVLHVWDGVDHYVDMCSEAVHALPSEHRVLMSARYDSFPLQHYSHATRELPADLLSDTLVRALQEEMVENPDFTLDGLELSWLIMSTGWHGGTLAAILRAWQGVPLSDIPWRLELGFPEGRDDPFLDPAVRQCLADLPSPVLDALSYLGLYGSTIIPHLVASFTDRSAADDDPFGTVTGTHISLDRWEELLDQAHRAGLLCPLDYAVKIGYRMSPLIGYALRGELARRVSPEQLSNLQRGVNISIAYALHIGFPEFAEGTIYAQQQWRNTFSDLMGANVRIAMLRAIDQADYDVAAAVADAYCEDVPVGSPAWRNAAALLSQIFRICRDQLESDPRSRNLSIVLHETMGKAATVRSDWSQAMTHIERILAYPDEPLVRENMLPLLLWRVDIALEMGDPNLVKAALADAVRHASAEANNEDALDQCRARLQGIITKFDLLPPATVELAREVGLPETPDDLQPAHLDDNDTRTVDTLLRELREAELGGQLSVAARLRRDLGKTASRAGDFEEARRWLTSAVELERSSSGIGDLAATAHLLAMLEENAGNLDDAASWCHVVLDLPSASALQKADAYHELGIVELARNRDDDALEALEAARSHYSAQGMHTFTASLDALGSHALYRKGDLAGAIELGESAVHTMMNFESDERTIDALVSLADIMRRSGDVQGTTEYFLRLLVAAGDLVLAEKFIRRVAQLLWSERTSDDERVIWFDEDVVKTRAGADGYKRALPYLAETSFLKASSDEVVATVGIDDGSLQVRLTGAEGWLIGECPCPEGRQGFFCVHCVAAAIMTVDIATTPPDTTALLAEVNALREPSELVGPSLLSWAEEAKDLLLYLWPESLFHPAAIRPLYQQLLWHVAHKTHWFETEEDYPALMEVKTRVMDGFARTCQAAPPDPGELACWLVDLRIDQADNATAVDLTEFVELLGTQGLDAYRRRLEELHRGLPAIDDEDDEPEPQATHRRKIRELLEEFLRAFADVDALIAFFAEDTSDPMRHISIANELLSAGRFEEAISWLERADPEYLGGDVLMAELYTATGRYREAARRRWRVFEILPSKENYDQLMAAAKPLDAVQYARNRALNLLRKVDDRLVNEAVPILLHEAGLAIDERRNYREAAQLLAELQELFRRRGRDFTTCLEQFKTTYGHDQNLLGALAEADL